MSVATTQLHAIPGHRLDASDVFEIGANGKPRFVGPRLSRALAAEAPVAVGGELLHVYQDGAYRPDGVQWARRRIVEVLGDDWTRSRSDEVLGHLRDGAAALLERPPLDVINTRNGLLDVHTGRLARHDADLLTPVQIGAAYEPDACCPIFDSYLDDVLPEDARTVFLELVAYLTTPDNRLQRAVMLLGSGANGKSVAAGVLAALLGDSNVSAIPLHKLDEDRFALAALYGKLANVFADLDARALRSSSVFKAVVGGDRLDAERKFRPPFTFTPYARLVFSANVVPPTSDSSDGFFRRWLTIPFERKITKPDRRLTNKLTTSNELSGLLNRALPLMADLRARGDFATADSIQRAGDEFRVHADSVAGFLDEQCTIAGNAEIAQPRLARAYREWCTTNGRGALSTARFNERLTALASVEKITRSGVRFWRGVQLHEDDR